MLILNKFLEEFQALSSRGAMTVCSHRVIKHICLCVFKFMIGNLHLGSSYCKTL